MFGTNIAEILRVSGQDRRTAEAAIYEEIANMIERGTSRKKLLEYCRKQAEMLNEAWPQF